MAKDLMLTPGAPANSGAAAPSKETMTQRAFIVGIGLAVMWGLEVIDAIIGQKLNGLGIEPRTLSGLIGIPLAPVLHGDFPHLIANTIPFAVLGFLTIMRGVSTFFVVTAFVTVVGGALVWIFGGSGFHIGASGLIFGYFGYNIAMGIFERSFKSILLAIVVALFYWTMVFGIFPGRAGVSWESHLFGAIAGGMLAFMTGKKALAAKKK